MSGSKRGRRERLNELLDKQEIVELSYRYMRGLDRLDRELQMAVFFEDASTDYGFFQGNGPDFVDFAQNALKDHLANHHMLGQCLIELTGDDEAFGEIYFHAFHRIVENGQEMDLIIAGRYVDRYEKRDGVWKIAHRSEVNDWARTSPAADEWLKGSASLLGKRKGEDLSYQRGRLGKSG